MVHCLNRSTGKAVWTFTTRARVESSPLIAGNRVFVGSNDGVLYELDLVVRQEDLGVHRRAPALGVAGRGQGALVDRSQDGVLYLLRDAEPAIMKIAYITAGAGHMYCGSCLRDNTLATALLAAGHDVMLIPTYTPDAHRRTECQPRPRVPRRHQRLPPAAFRVLPQTPWVLDRLLDFAPLLRLATRWGVSVDPAPAGRHDGVDAARPDGFQRKEIAKLVRFLADDVAPDIVTLPNSLLIALAPAIKADLNVPVCCTFQGEELFLDGLGEPYRSRSRSS